MARSRPKSNNRETRGDKREHELLFAKYYLFACARSLGKGKRVFFRTYGKTKAEQICRMLARDPAVGTLETPLVFETRPASSLKEHDCVIYDRSVDQCVAKALEDKSDRPTSESDDIQVQEILEHYCLVAYFWQTRLRKEALDRPSRLAIANAFLAITKLNCLIQVCRDYPNAITPSEAIGLFTRFVEAIDAALSDPSLRSCRRIYKRPRFDDVELRIDFVAFGGQLLMRHPKFDPDRVDGPQSAEHMDELVSDCENNADDELKLWAFRIDQVMIVECRFPDAPNRPDLSDKRRHLAVLHQYFRIVYRIVFEGVITDRGLRLFPILDIIEYLRSRSTILFRELKEVPGVIAAAQDLMQVLDAVVVGSSNGVPLGVDEIRQKTMNVDQFFIRAQLVCGSTPSTPTVAEEFFLSNTTERIDRYFQWLNAREGAAGTERVDPREVIPFTNTNACNAFPSPESTIDIIAAKQSSIPNDSKLRDEVNRLNKLDRKCIRALFANNILGPKAAISPGQKTLSEWTNCPFDTTFKNALTGLVKAGLLDNHHHHGGRGGYFLTLKGERAGRLISAD